MLLLDISFRKMWNSFSFGSSFAMLPMGVLCVILAAKIKTKYIASWHTGGVRLSRYHWQHRINGYGICLIQVTLQGLATPYAYSVTEKNAAHSPHQWPLSKTDCFGGRDLRKWLYTLIHPDSQLFSFAVKFLPRHVICNSSFYLQISWDNDE